MNTLLEIIDKAPPAVLLGILFLSVIFAMVVMALVAKNYMRVNLADKSIEISPVDPGKKSAHKKCKHSKEAIMFYYEVIELIDKRNRLKYIECLKDQMSYAELRAEHVKEILYTNYIELLQSKAAFKDSDNVTKTPGFANFRLVIFVIEKEAIDIVRRSFRENHYTEMNPDQFERKAEEIIDAMIIKASNTMSDLFSTVDGVTREELFQKNMSQRREIFDILMDVFLNARRAALNIKEEIDKIDEKLSKNLKWMF
jgi:BMFP domain-containing protein YqiC